jgi:hypothetical protein
MELLCDALELEVEVVDVDNHVGNTKDGMTVPMERWCTKCKSKFIATAIFCRRCGTRREAELTDVEPITFVEFLKMLHAGRTKGVDSAFSHLVSQVEGKVKHFHGQNLAYLILFLSFLAFVGTSTVRIVVFRREQ